MSVTLKHQLPPRYCVVLFNFHEEYAAMTSVEHKLANTVLKLELCDIEKNLTTPYPFYRNFDDTYQITVQLERLVN